LAGYLLPIAFFLPPPPTKETGNVILIKDDIRDVAVALEIAKATMCKVKQNLFWAFIYNSFGILLWAGLLSPFFSLIISPELAGLMMAVSSITVILSTLLLKGFKPSIRYTDSSHLGKGQPGKVLAPATAGSD
jgi:Cu+-exporting ATPase